MVIKDSLTSEWAKEAKSFGVTVEGTPLIPGWNKLVRVLHADNPAPAGGGENWWRDWLRAGEYAQVTLVLLGQPGALEPPLVAFTREALKQ